MRPSIDGQDRADRRRPCPFRAFARALLQLEGFEVVGEAADARSALRRVRRLRPSVVLFDIQLRYLDGFEVTRRLAQAGIPQLILLNHLRTSSIDNEIEDHTRAATKTTPLAGEVVEEGASAMD